MLQRVQKQPMFNVPLLVVGLCLVFIALFALQDWLGPEQNLDVLNRFAFVPARVSVALDPAALKTVISVAQAGDEAQRSLAQVRFFVGAGDLKPWTAITYGLLHGSWSHVLINCMAFLAFGSAVARRFSTLRLIVLMLAATLAGAAAHYVTHRYAPVPLVGASAMVAGCVGAAARFVFAPGAPFGAESGLHFFSVNSAYRLPAQSLMQVLKTRSALVFVLTWLLGNVLVGLMPQIDGLSEGSIAWQAHIGGLLAGLLLFPLLDRA